MAHYAKIRQNTQPQGIPSAGSAFKRPPGYVAAKMIDDCGLKGFTIGGAQVSEKHAGFIVNTGAATAADVLAVMAHVQNTIHKQYGVWLKSEIKVIGIE
jgi:UDP-N-acetylmuramate dehydrogenase